MGIPYLDISNDQLFPCTNICFICWILLALLPRWKFTFPIVKVISLLFAVLYVLLIIEAVVFSPVEGTGISDFSNLDGLLKLFSNKSTMFAGWVHYIVFDIWTGMWITNDANISGFPQLLLIPCLFFTLMLGPTGLLLYLGLKTTFGYKSKEKLI